MPKFEIKQRRSGGKFARRCDVYMYDRQAPAGFIYQECESLQQAREVVAFEVKAFTALGLPVQVIGAQPLT